MLDRCEVLLRNFPEDEYFRGLVLKECESCLKMIISSGRDLSLWNVYKAARRLSRTYKEELDLSDQRIHEYFLKYKDFKQAFNKYVWDTVTSRERSVADKKIALYNKLISGLRRKLI